MYKEEKSFFAQMYNHFGYSPGGVHIDGVFYINHCNILDKEKLRTFVERTDFLGNITKIELMKEP